MMGECMGATFFDIKAAYDNINPSILFNVVINDLKNPKGLQVIYPELKIRL